MVITPRGIAAASRTGDLHMIAGDGELRWRTELGSPCTALALTGEELCVGLEDGRVLWVGLDGGPLRATGLPGVARQLLSCDGAVAAATDDGALCMLEG